MNFYPLFYKSILLIYIFIGGCVTTPKILFEDPVDTKNKRISIQEKKTFSFEQAGVYFSNDFLGARLNNVIKKMIHLLSYQFSQKINLLIQVHFMPLRYGAELQKK